MPMEPWKDRRRACVPVGPKNLVLQFLLLDGLAESGQEQWPDDPVVLIRCHSRELGPAKMKDLKFSWA